MVADDHRGYIMELMATKLLSLEQDVQIVGMSATLPVSTLARCNAKDGHNADGFQNTEELATWLNAKYYHSAYSPVPISEFLVYVNSIYQTPNSASLRLTASQLRTSTTSTTHLPPCRLVSPSPHPYLSNPTLNAVVALALETVHAGYGALVFCGSRAGCQTTASLIADAMPDPRDLAGEEDQEGEEMLERRTEVLNELRGLMMLPLDETLERTVGRGVAFHRKLWGRWTHLRNR